MDEYIKREDALKIIDNYSKAVTEEGAVVVNAIRDIVAVITPTADVVEVVRCRNCKYFKMAGTTPRCNFYKGLATTVNPPTDYCSYGKPNEGES